MKVYVDVHGRKIGAIGRGHHHHLVVDVPEPITEEAVRLACYETHEHLTGFAMWVPCPGQAHDPEVGGMVDNCGMCAPQWGRVPLAKWLQWEAQKNPCVCGMRGFPEGTAGHQPGCPGERDHT